MTRSGGGILAIAKVQWKIDILKHKAKIVDNQILQSSLTYYIIANRIQTLSKHPKNESIAQEEGSDLYSLLSKDPKFIKIEIENKELYEEIKKIEQSHKRQSMLFDISNQDLVQANHLLEASRKM